MIHCCRWQCYGSTMPMTNVTARKRPGNNSSKDKSCNSKLTTAKMEVTTATEAFILATMTRELTERIKENEVGVPRRNCKTRMLNQRTMHQNHAKVMKHLSLV